MSSCRCGGAGAAGLWDRGACGPGLAGFRGAGGRGSLASRFRPGLLGCCALTSETRSVKCKFPDGVCVGFLTDMFSTVDKTERGCVSSGPGHLRQAGPSPRLACCSPAFAASGALDTGSGASMQAHMTDTLTGRTLSAARGYWFWSVAGTPKRGLRASTCPGSAGKARQGPWCWLFLPERTRLVQYAAWRAALPALRRGCRNTLRLLAFFAVLPAARPAALTRPRCHPLAGHRPRRAQ